MKAAFKTVNGDIIVRETPSLKLETDHIRVKVEACGICGTDLHAAKKESQFGHEVAGEVIEIGPKVMHIEVGDKVVLDSATPCGKCDNCKNKNPELCSKLRSFFCVPSFGFAEEIVVPEICAIKYDGITPQEACLQEPLGVAIDVFKLCDINSDSNVLVIGQGPIGLMALALAVKAGARTFVSDFGKRTGRKKLAEKLGAAAWIEPEELKEYDFACNIDRIIVTAPPAALPSAFDVAATGAVIAFIGIGGEGKEYCTFNADAFHFKKLQLRGSFASPALYGPLAVKYLKEKIINGKDFISHTFKLEDISEAIKCAVEDPKAVKIVIEV